MGFQSSVMRSVSLVVVVQYRLHRYCFFGTDNLRHRSTSHLGDRDVRLTREHQPPLLTIDFLVVHEEDNVGNLGDLHLHLTVEQRHPLVLASLELDALSVCDEDHMHGQVSEGSDKSSHPYLQLAPLSDGGDVGVTRLVVGLRLHLDHYLIFTLLSDLGKRIEDYSSVAVSSCTQCVEDGRVVVPGTYGEDLDVRMFTKRRLARLSIDVQYVPHSWNARSRTSQPSLTNTCFSVDEHIQLRDM